MKLKFRVHYRTAWGESLHAVVTYYCGDTMRRSQNVTMQTDDGEIWTGETSAVVSRQHSVKAFSYRYQVEDGSGRELRREWEGIPRLYSFDMSKDYLLYDIWRDMPLQHHLYSSAFLTAARRKPGEEVAPLPLPLFRRTLLFRVAAPQLKPGQSVAICGSHPSLGEWSPTRYLKMEYAGRCEWMLTVNVDGMALPLEYKYVVVDDATGALVQWEEGANRQQTEAIADGQVLVCYGESLRVKEETWRAAGVVVPVFSLRSHHSYGVGDFGDLQRMVDWAAEAGMSVIQMLPVNDTTHDQSWGDSNPYNAVSAFALHPHYADLNALARLKDKEKMMAYRRQQSELNAQGSSDYEAVGRVKNNYLHDLYSEQGEHVKGSDAFREFVKENGEWLYPYAAFCSLRDRYHTAHFDDWPQLSAYDKSAVNKYCEQEKEDIDFVLFTQFILHQQLKQAKEYAQSKGVVLMGDFAVGISRDSVETWQHPEMFNMDMQMGTPAENSSQNGQNWRFPTFNYANEGTYHWFQKRLRHMERYFDAIRIDYILGYFRTWEIPSDTEQGLLGHYSPSLPMTVSEIEHFGFPFRKDFCTLPFINNRIIDRLFGIHSQYVREHFLYNRPYGLYGLKEEVSTERGVERCFANAHDENSIWIRDGLYKLIANVLFVEDPSRPDTYHPRLGVEDAPVFDALNDEERDAYVRLYNHYFNVRHDMFWAALAQQKLNRILKDTRMLVCGEDLGVSSDSARRVLDTLRILTLEIQTMPKCKGMEFAYLGSNPYRSVSTISTHDMPPLRLWWEENQERAQHYYALMLQKEGRAPEHLPAHLAEEIIARHLYSPSMLCMLSLQDWLSIDSELRAKNPRCERINVPGNSLNRWQWRMHLTMEQLMAAQQLNKKLQTLITRSKR